MGDISTIDSTENILKTVIRVHKNLRYKFYKDFKENSFSIFQIKLRDFDKSFPKMIEKFFNHPIAAVMEHQDKILRGFRKNSEREYMLLRRTFTVLGEPNDPISNMQYWLSNQNHKISECSQLIALTVEERLKFVKQSGFYFNCLSNSYIMKECKSKSSCRIDKCNKRYHTLLHPPGDKYHHHIADDHNTEKSKNPN